MHFLSQNIPLPVDVVFSSKFLVITQYQMYLEKGFSLVRYPVTHFSRKLHRDGNWPG